MKKERIIRVGALWLVCALFATMFFVAVTENVDADETGYETPRANGVLTRIVSSRNYFEDPLIYDDKIVYTEKVYTYPHGGSNLLYLYDLSTKSKRLITCGSFHSVDFHSNKIVWVNTTESTNWDIYMYDLTTNTTIPICIERRRQEDPDVFGDKVVWSDSRNGARDIYMYNLTTHEELQITTNTDSQFEPAIYGDIIVWRDRRNYYTTEYDIYMYDLSVGQEKQITTNEKSQEKPDIFKDKIVWQDWRNGTKDIYMYDLSTNQEIPICANVGYQSRPTIHDNKVIWYDSRYTGGSSNLYVYDLATKQESEIRATISTWTGEKKIDIFNNKIVWMEHRNEYGTLKNYICMFTLFEEPEFILLAPTINILKSGTNGTIPVFVTTFDAPLTTIQLDVLDNDGLTIDVKPQTKYIEADNTVTFILLIDAPDISTEKAIEYEIVIQASSGEWTSNNVTIHLLVENIDIASGENLLSVFQAGFGFASLLVIIGFIGLGAIYSLVQKRKKP